MKQNEEPDNAVMHSDIKAVTYLLKCLLAPE